MRWVKYMAFLATLLSALSQSYAQSESMKYGVWGYYHYGYILSHRNDIEVLVKGHTRIGEVSFVIQGEGQKEWHQKYNYPTYGLSWFYIDFGNPEQLGFGTSLAAFYDFPITRGNKFKLLFKIGFGPGYVQKVFDRLENYQNYAVSSHFNGFAHGNFHGTYQFSKSIEASLGLSISHFSNASYSKPNLGINIPAINVGVAYRFKEVERVPKKDKSEYLFNQKINHDVVGTFFVKERNPIGGDKYPTYSLLYSASKHVSYKSKLLLGADFMYNTAHKGTKNEQGKTIESAADVAQLGLNFGYALQVSNFALFFNQGVYLYTKYTEDGMLYNRFGVRYYVNDKIIINVSMKTHFAVADNAEFGIGYRF